MRKKSLLFGGIGGILAGLGCGALVMWMALRPSPSESVDKSTQQAARRIVIETGQAKVVGRRTVGPAGGTVTADEADSPMAGLKIEVPRGAYRHRQQFRISCAPVAGHNLGETFHPVSPLIEVDNGAQHADEPMKVTIPVEVPEDHVATAFFYHEDTGRLEAIPPVAQYERSITVATRHFSKLIVASALMPDLLGGTFDSGFRPADDGWQVPNRGTCVSPKGLCHAWSATAVWYYVEKARQGRPDLYGLYDNDTPRFWKDDAAALKFLSMVQKDGKWDNPLGKLRTGLRRVVSDDVMTYLTFAHALKVTGEPQLVGVERRFADRHMMVVYKADGGTLHVADSNAASSGLFAGASPERQSIRLNGESFRPYETPGGKKYSRIFFIGQGECIRWQTIASRWSELRDGTIGSGAFPSFKLDVQAVADGSDEQRRVRLRISGREGLLAEAVRNGQSIALTDSGGRLDAKAISTGPDEKYVDVVIWRADELEPPWDWAGFARIGLPEQVDRPPEPSDPLVYEKWPFGAAEAKRRQKQTAAALGVPVEKTLDLGDGVTMKLVLIPAGQFVMGSGESAEEVARKLGGNDEWYEDEHPQRRVTLTEPFYMGVCEVTQAQYEQVLGKAPSRGEWMAKSGAEHAASDISWDDATAFCKKLSGRTGLDVQLPTEAQWEYACRAGSTTRYCYGDDAGKLGAYAWYDDNACDVGDRYAHTVGRKKPNAFGLHDMHGNVWEWCGDWSQDSYRGLAREDPKGPRSGTSRVLRGGSWLGRRGGCRSANRSRIIPDYRSSDFGFRVVVLGGGVGLK